MKFFNNLSGPGRSSGRRSRRSGSRVTVESMERRTLLTANALPVLMVVADHHDFYYQEYGDTRNSLESAGLEVQVAATTMSPSTPHPNSGQGGSSGIVNPDLTLAQVDVDDYSAILFVGGWGSSMYQYSFPGDYSNDHYDGDPATKQIVNDLISEFTAQDKYVTAICHGVTVLAWAEVDGVSPLAGKQVSVPFIGSPAVVYDGVFYDYYQLGQYEQVVANGGIANTASGQYGDPATVADDAVADGRVITAENYDAAAWFGLVVAQHVIAAAEANEPPANQAPVVDDVTWQLSENSAVATVAGIVVAADPDAGQTLVWSIVAGNVSNAFAIDAATGQITVNNQAAIDFETNPVIQLTVQVADNGTPSLNDNALVTIELQDVNENPPASVHLFGSDLIVQGTSGADTIYIWSGQSASQVFVWMNGVQHGSWNLPGSGRTIVRGGDGNDRIFANDTRSPLSIYGEGGHDMINGGSVSDSLDGGDGVDRIWGYGGNDVILGGTGNDFVFGMDGNDMLVGGGGDDYLEGAFGNDVLIGGLGSDYMKAGAGDDLLIGDRTLFDEDRVVLAAILTAWNSGGSLAQRRQQLTTGIGNGIQLAWGSTVLDDSAADTMCGGEDNDLFFAGLGDALYGDLNDLFELR